MKTKTKNPFAGVHKVALFGVVCVLLFAVVSCEKAKEESQQYDRATGTIIGAHFCHESVFLVQVDDSYPIGVPLEAGDILCPRLRLGAFSNVIVIQRLEGIEILAGKVIGTPRISFSYRAFCWENDPDLHDIGIQGGLHDCAPIYGFPRYVVTEFQLLN